ncbi:hypothetical protein [Streptomyces sp. NPDC059009]|uniref:hypothetical protein n=1 Tax=Streptomyces sp. NPDC059009 TaxID=3346694 RepID=UPI0036A7D912
MDFTLIIQEPSSGEPNPHVHMGIGTMAAAVDALDALGMISHSSARPDPPRPEDFGVTEAETERWRGTRIPDLPDHVRTFAKALVAMAESEAEHPDGIPCYKLTSNRGWLVTPREISAAFGWWASASRERRRQATDGLAWWPSWIDFLKRARDHGGFRVW